MTVRGCQDERKVYMELVSVADATTPASEPARQIVLRTERLSKQFGKLTAVQNLNLEVHRGDVFGLLGPNGSGKTTTLRMLLGLIWPSNGQIYLFGDPMNDGHLRRRALQRIGAIVEQPAFYPYLSGRENLRGDSDPDIASGCARDLGRGLEGYACQIENGLLVRLASDLRGR